MGIIEAFRTLFSRRHRLERESAFVTAAVLALHLKREGRA